MTQDELAHKAGVGVRTIRDIESGRVRPQAATLRLLAEALGLNETDRALMAGSPERPPVAPRELPRPPAEFAGRKAQLDTIIAAVDRGSTVVAVHGMAGVGKTSLALASAHALADRYPDGQLFADLHGFTRSEGPGPGLQPVLTGLLRRLGLSDPDIPADVDDLTTCFRSAVADRRVLLVLDDAASAEQVEALLPGTPSGLTLVTSRRDMSPLSGVYPVPLEPPSMPEAVEMLAAAVADRITEEEAATVAEYCGRLPLAIGLAAARLRSRPLWKAEDLLERLADEDRLLSELDMGFRGVVAALNASYRELDYDHRRLLRRLGLVPGDDVDARAAAALCDVDEARASAMLENLVDFHLAETRTPGRYGLHDLVRRFAVRVVELEESEDEREEAFGRLLGMYLHYAYRVANQWTLPSMTVLAEGAAAHDLGLPGLEDRESADAWYRAERGNLAAAVFAAERVGWLEAAWHLATATSAFRIHDRDNERLLIVNQLALELSRRLGDERKESYSLADRGRHLLFMGSSAEAVDCLEQAAALQQRLGDVRAAALSMRMIGLLHRQSGRFAESLAVYREALELAEATGEDKVIVLVRANMFNPLLLLGRLAEAEQCLVESEQRLDADDLYNPVRIANFRGTLLRESGDPAAALDLHTTCLETCRERGFRGGIVPVLIELGEDLLRLDRVDEAVSRLVPAVEYAEEVANPAYERTARNHLGRALTASGLTEEAIGHHERAAALAESDGDLYELARAHHGLADAHRLRGDTVAERQHLRRAARKYRECGVPEAARTTERLRDLELLRGGRRAHPVAGSRPTEFWDSRMLRSTTMAPPMEAACATSSANSALTLWT